MYVFSAYSGTSVSGVKFYHTRVLPPPPPPPSCLPPASLCLLCFTSSASPLLPHLLCFTSSALYRPPWSPPLSTRFFFSIVCHWPHGRPHYLPAAIWICPSLSVPHGSAHYRLPLAHGRLISIVCHHPPRSPPLSIYRLPPGAMAASTIHMDLLSIVCPWLHGRILYPHGSVIVFFSLYGYFPDSTFVSVFGLACFSFSSFSLCVAVGDFGVLFVSFFKARFSETW